MLREAASRNSEKGLEAKKYMEKGELVPDEIVVDLVAERIQRSDAKSGFILDGFPRNISQATILNRTLDRLRMPVDLVINFQTSVDTIIERLSGRRVCKACGANYHIRNIPPKKDGICDRCGGGLYQRKDDNEETVRNRLRVYEEQTAALIDYYQREGIARSVSGDMDVGTVNTVLTELFEETAAS
jgi:adenylate kinase